jgi:hypothetical protein
MATVSQRWARQSALVLAAAGLSVSAEMPKSKGWRDYAGSLDGTSYVALDQITKSNADKLEGLEPSLRGNGLCLIYPPGKYLVRGAGGCCEEGLDEQF